MHSQDGDTPTNIGPIKHHLPIKTPRSQQCWIKYIGTVGGRNHDHIGIGIEAIHLDQNLVQCLFTLIVRTAQTGSALSSYGVDLIHENDTRTVAFGLIKQVTYTAGTHAHKHLHKLGAANAEE